MDDLLILARTAIESHFNHEEIDYCDIHNPSLDENGASFVTLTQNGKLRGCIGSIIPHRPLGKDIISNAISSAFNDPRFPPLTQAELEITRIEVSVLTTPEPLQYENIEDLKSKIKVGIDGVILKHQFYQSTFLPQVWEELDSFELFFSHLCQKAGLDGSCLRLHPDILTYQVKKVKEN